MTEWEPMTFLMRALMATAGQRQWDGSDWHYEMMCRELARLGLCSEWPGSSATPKGLAAISRAREKTRLLQYPPPRLVSSGAEVTPGEAGN